MIGNMVWWHFPAVIFIASILDAILGDPVYSWHPVRLFGKLISKMEKDLYPRSNDKTYLLIVGGILVAMSIVTVGIVYYSLILLSRRSFGSWSIIFEAVLAYQLLATRCLFDEGARIISVIRQGDLDLAREQVGYLVSRDTKKLNFDAITKAAVETLTENITDAIVAPYIYLALFGVPGLAIYKVINTMDSMIGYKNSRYLYFGRSAARLDDVVNFIPARLAVIMIWIATPLLRGNLRQSIACFMAHRKFHASPNAGCTESAMAGALEIQLSGPTLYFGKVVNRKYIGFHDQVPQIGHILKANRYVILCGLQAAIFSIPLACLSPFVMKLFS